jgi:hypothetical protein
MGNSMEHLTYCDIIGGSSPVWGAVALRSSSNRSSIIIRTEHSSKALLYQYVIAAIPSEAAPMKADVVRPYNSR